ncbi:chlororespiratory reduction protein 7 [Leptothermofonsia sp. ETS-13]|uniref:chlororespiratory reduction protein 7 n=1 Tax=Leptothermofonsia sp. ETS-13 TaxID=3035696 RepID=UPI003BA2A103
MPDPRLYESDTYVLLEPGQAERFFSTSEMLERLQKVLAELQDELPRDLQKFSSVQEQAKYLLETSCELEVEPGQFLQWYAVRLEK